MMPEKTNKLSNLRKQALETRMLDLGIREADIEEKFVRSRGKGGQHVNKVSTCVYLKHTPSGTEVKCQRQRSQNLNRVLAREILVNKIEKDVRKKIRDANSAIAKIKRQKRKRSKPAKEKMLKAKKKKSLKKESRAFRPAEEDLK